MTQDKITEIIKTLEKHSPDETSELGEAMKKQAPTYPIHKEKTFTAQIAIIGFCGMMQFRMNGIITVEYADKQLIGAKNKVSKITKETLDEILLNHGKWLQEKYGGAKANLQGANLKNADLRWANLKGANLKNADLQLAHLKDADLQDANLQGANLQNADLRGVNFQDADLQGANLQDADLRGVNFQDADLRWANLEDTNLKDADLRGVNFQDADLRWATLQGADLTGANIFGTILNFQCPEEGSFIAWKKLEFDCIAKLVIPEDAKRSSGTSRKCRASKALVLSIYKSNGQPTDSGISKFDSNTTYRVGEVVYPDKWDEDRWSECSNGIHFFITRKEAEEY